jgi:redox-sensitive bicupin YhaK (pirin superfamily)
MLFEAGDEVIVQLGGDGIRFFRVSGKPLEEACRLVRPNVMTTQEELRRGSTIESAEHFC